MAKKKSEYTQAGIAKTAKGLAAAGFMLYSVFLINGGAYLDTSGIIAKSGHAATAIAPNDDDDDENLWAKKLGLEE